MAHEKNSPKKESHDETSKIQIRVLYLEHNNSLITGYESFSFIYVYNHGKIPLRLVCESKFRVFWALF